MQNKKSKGQAVSLGSAPAIVMILVMLGVLIAFGALFQESIQEQIMAGLGANQTDSVALSVVNESIGGLEVLGEWQPILAIAIIIAIALSIILGLFAFKGRGGI